MANGFDRREAILSRVAFLLGGTFVNGVWQSGGLTIPMVGDSNSPKPITSIPAANFTRNRNDLTKITAPAVILLDADEVRDPATAQRPRGMIENRMPDQLMKMTPEIYVVLDVRGKQNANSGQDLNAARLTILSALIPDKYLQAYCSAHGSMTYDGTVTDFARNRKMEGQLGLSLTFTYPLIGGEVMGIVG